MQMGCWITEGLKVQLYNILNLIREFLVANSSKVLTFEEPFKPEILIKISVKSTNYFNEIISLKQAKRFLATHCLLNRRGRSYCWKFTSEIWVLNGWEHRNRTLQTVNMPVDHCETLFWALTANLVLLVYGEQCTLYNVHMPKFITRPRKECEECSPTGWLVWMASSRCIL